MESVATLPGLLACPMSKCTCKFDMDYLAYGSTQMIKNVSKGPKGSLMAPLDIRVEFPRASGKSSNINKNKYVCHLPMSHQTGIIILVLLLQMMASTP